jgi:hypothetical protein
MLVESLIGWKVRCDYVSENLFWWRGGEHQSLTKRERGMEEGKEKI